MRLPLREVRSRLERVFLASGLEDSDVTVLLVSDAGIRRLNKDYAGIDSSTDCLSFPFEDEAEPGAPRYLGDIAISVETALSQSGANSTSDERFLSELERLFVHSLLHLVGFDHQDEQQMQEMRRREEDILLAARQQGKH